MSEPINPEDFTQAMYFLLDETFESVHGIFLDKGTSLFETLTTISAEEASIPVGGKCATLAAQVKHVAFYLEVTIESVKNPDFPPADWDEIWRNTGAVTSEEWEKIQNALRNSYTRTRELVQETKAWDDPYKIGGAIGVVVHSAYHLGEIRQALCTLKN